MKIVLNITLGLFLSVMNPVSNSDDSEQIRLCPYIFKESTGDNMFVVFNKAIQPIRDFSKSSNTEAVDALKQLKSNVLYPNSDGTRIFLIGHYDVNTRMFSLRGWFIVSPFLSTEVIDEKSLPHEIRNVKKIKLDRSDFSGEVRDLGQYVRSMSSLIKSENLKMKSQPAAKGK
jgi:hypothetical protein